MQAAERRERVRYWIQQEPHLTQEELSARLFAEGVIVTQSTLSRDLAEIGAVKRKGAYVFVNPVQSPLQQAGFLSANPAGPHLLVVKTEVGAAQRVGLVIDQQAFPGVVGTLAGDDTIFVALESAEVASALLRSWGVEI